MLMKSIAAGLAGTALLATVAFAQNPSATTDKSAANTATTTTTSASGDWRASKMAGLKVYNDANENIGSINDLLMDKSGNIKIAVIGVGGFLGMGEHLVAIPYDKLKFVNEAVAYTGTGANNNAATNRLPTGPLPPPRPRVLRPAPTRPRRRRRPRRNGIRTTPCSTRARTS